MADPRSPRRLQAPGSDLRAAKVLAKAVNEGLIVSFIDSSRPGGGAGGVADTTPKGAASELKRSFKT